MATCTLEPNTSPKEICIWWGMKCKYYPKVCPTCGKAMIKKPVDCKDPIHAAKWAKQQARNKAYHQKWYAKNREKKLAQNKEWDEAHAEERKEYFRKQALAWYHNNKKQARKRERAYYENNKKRINGRRNRLMKERRKRDPVASIKYCMRSRLSTFLSTAQPGRQFSITRDIFTYTVEQLKQHLESQFEPGMSWENYGKKPGCWEVDHIVPCSEFDLSKIEDILECYALENLRPLWAEKNRSRKYNKKRRKKP
jgi:hypothetical protein